MREDYMDVDILGVAATAAGIEQFISKTKQAMREGASEPVIVNSRPDASLGDDGLYLLYDLQMKIYDLQRFGGSTISQLLKDDGLHAKTVRTQVRQGNAKS